MAAPVPRTLQPKLRSLARRFPVVTVTGPRQSGKTTLCRMAFPGKPHANLEAPDVREFASADPRGFLAQYPRGAILDEIQRAPDLLSYLHDRVDRSPRAGSFILTGSQHLGLLESVSQSLAGRTAVLHLLPLGLDEVRRFRHPPRDLFSLLLAGGYPRILDRRIPAPDFLAAYTETYVERDVRQVLRVGDLGAFQTFLRLCAGRVGQILNLSGLGSDAGITHNTARAWITVLEAGFLVFRLPPFLRNFGKRLTKSPKIYFHDTGLLCYLLGIRDRETLRLHPLRGSIFESWVISEIVKHRAHRGLSRDLFFYRDARGLEVDAVLDLGRRLVAAEIKSGETVAADFLEGLDAFAAAASRAPARLPRVDRVLIHAGAARQVRQGVTILPWKDVQDFRWS